MSLYSLHAQHFDAPDSRPGSGPHLVPLDHVSTLTHVGGRHVTSRDDTCLHMSLVFQKPKFPVLCNGEGPSKAFPQPQSVPVDVRRGPTGAPTRPLRAGSLPTFTPALGLPDGEKVASRPLFTLTRSYIVQWKSSRGNGNGNRGSVQRHVPFHRNNTTSSTSHTCLQRNEWSRQQWPLN